MTLVPIPEDCDRQTVVAFVLRQCALVVDPRYGKLSTLADEIDVHYTTLSLWIQEGRVPERAAKRLQRRFGKKLINTELLTLRAE